MAGFRRMQGVMLAAAAAAMLLALGAGCSWNRRTPERLEPIRAALEKSFEVDSVQQTKGRGADRGATELSVIYESESLGKRALLRDEFVQIAKICKQTAPEPFDYVWIEARETEDKFGYKKIKKHRGRIYYKDIERARFLKRKEV